MALTDRSQYHTYPPADYDKYDVPPAPLRKGDEQKIMYWLDLLYLYEWAFLINVVSRASYSGYPRPERKVLASQLVPSDVCDNATHISCPVGSSPGYVDPGQSVFSMVINAMHPRGAGGNVDMTDTVSQSHPLWLAPGAEAGVNITSRKVSDGGYSSVKNSQLVADMGLSPDQDDSSVYLVSSKGLPKSQLTSADDLLELSGSQNSGTHLGIKLSVILSLYDACALFRYWLDIRGRSVGSTSISTQGDGAAYVHAVRSVSASGGSKGANDDFGFSFGFNWDQGEVVRSEVDEDCQLVEDSHVTPGDADLCGRQIVTTSWSNTDDHTFTKPYGYFHKYDNASGTLFSMYVSIHNSWRLQSTSSDRYYNDKSSVTHTVTKVRLGDDEDDGYYCEENYSQSLMYSQDVAYWIDPGSASVSIDAVVPPDDDLVWMKIDDGGRMLGRLYTNEKVCPATVVSLGVLIEVWARESANGYALKITERYQDFKTDELKVTKTVDMASREGFIPVTPSKHGCYTVALDVGDVKFAQKEGSADWYLTYPYSKLMGQISTLLGGASLNVYDYPFVRFLLTETDAGIANAFPDPESGIPAPSSALFDGIQTVRQTPVGGEIPVRTKTVSTTVPNSPSSMDENTSVYGDVTYSYSSPQIIISINKVFGVYHWNPPVRV